MNRFIGETLSLSDLRHPALRQAYDYWRLRRDQREFPSRADISPEGMKAFLKYVMLIDVFHEPLNFIYRVFGTGIATAHRKDFTRKSVREIEPSEFSDLIWSNIP